MRTCAGSLNLLRARFRRPDPLLDSGTMRAVDSVALPVPAAILRFKCATARRRLFNVLLRPCHAARQQLP